MVILGLGSNEGHCLTHLRQALAALRDAPQLQVLAVSPVYHSDALLPDDAPGHWDHAYLNAAVAIRTALTPTALVQIAKKIEAQIGRQQSGRWAPRVVDIDLLAWGDQHYQDADLTVPHKGLLERPFALWPLLDLLPDWRIPTPGAHAGQLANDLIADWGNPLTGEQAPLRTRRIAQRIDTPALVGIVNVTPDSFSDGKDDFGVQAILTQIDALVQDGAEVIDIGAESTRPKATVLSDAEEWARLGPVLDALHHHAWPSTAIQPLISIDTYHPATAEKVLAWGADWLNDVGGKIPGSLLAEHPHAKYVMMRPRSAPLTGLGKEPIEQCLAWCTTRQAELMAAGVGAEQLIFDPGFGFGPDPQQSLSMLPLAAHFKQLGLPVLIGHSRKSFLGHCTTQHASERDPETLAISLKLADQGVDYLRVHQVQWHARAFALRHHWALANNRVC